MMVRLQALASFWLWNSRPHKNTTPFKSGQKWPENNHLETFTEVESKPLIHSVGEGNLKYFYNLLQKKTRDIYSNFAIVLKRKDVKIGNKNEINVKTS